jgi:hypothetical protein
LFAFNTTGFSTENRLILHGVASQFGQLGSADAVTAQELGFDAQRFHLAQHRAGHSVHAAKEHDVRLLGLQSGQDGIEVRSFVGGEFVTDDGATSSGCTLLELFSHALAVSGTVIDHSDVFTFERFHSVLAEGATQVNVVSHHAERAGVTLTCVLGVGRRWGDLWNASSVVQLRSWNSGAGVQVTDHTIDFGINQFLSSSCALLRISGIVFGQQFKFDCLVADFQTSGIELFNGHAGAVFVVFTQVGNGTTDRANVTNFDHCGVGCGIFFATSSQNNCGNGHRNQSQRTRTRKFHRNSENKLLQSSKP